MIAIIVLTLASIAALTLLGMAFMMTVDAFGIGPALGYVAGLALFGVALWQAPAPTILTLMLLAGACLIGIAGPLIIGAIIGRKTLMTSWPMQQEQMFQTYEHRAAGSHTTAMVAGMVTAAVMFVFAMGVKYGVDPQIKDIGKTMNMENLSSPK
jgi:MFS family permease